MNSNSTMMWLTMTPTRLAHERHESEWRPHDIQGRQRADHAVGNRCKHQKGLDGVLELKHQRQKNSRDGDDHDEAEVFESVDLRFFFTPDLHVISGRQSLLEVGQLRADGVHGLGGQDAGDRIGLGGDRSEVFPSAQLLRLHLVRHAGHLAQRHLGGPL
jgi:hypothetical protein